MTNIVAGIEYYNVIVPEFDSRGCPDLLGWDEAMDDADDDEQDVWATFHDEDIAKLCKPVIEDFFNKHHKDQYDEFMSGEPTFLFRVVIEDDDDNSPANLHWFWDEVIGDYFNWDLVEEISKHDYDYENFNKNILNISKLFLLLFFTTYHIYSLHIIDQF